MGICCSGPLPKVVSGAGRVGGLAGLNYDEVLRQHENEEEDAPKNFYCFQAFFAESKDPSIYEWRFIKELGKGATSVVYLCVNTETQEHCAAKIYNSTNIRKKPLGGEDPPFVAVQREIDILTQIQHRYILLAVILIIL